MQIIQIDAPKAKPRLQPRKLTWQDNFKRSIYKQNHEKILERAKKKDLVQQQESNLAVNRFIHNLETNPRELQRQFYQPQSQQNYYTPYSIYIPLQNQSFMNDEILNTFPYIKSISDQLHKDEKKKCYIEINDLFSKKRQNTIEEQWIKVKNRYLCTLDTVISLAILVQITKKGVSAFNNLYQQFSPRCHKKVFIHRVLKTVKYLRPIPKLYNNLKLSVELGEKITLKTLAHTPKSMYCPICFIYDCGRHHCENKCIDEQYHTVNYNNKINQDQHIFNIIKLFQFHNTLSQEQEMVEESEELEQFCSDSCYKNLKKNTMKRVSGMKYKLMSPLVKSLIQMGIHLFSYNPCSIASIFKIEKKPKDQISCQLLYVHLIEDCSLMDLINFKMEKSQVDFLMKEGKQINVQDQVSKTHKNKTNYIDMRQKNSFTQIPICFHNFIDIGTFDPNCNNCCCKMRGFCLPSCQCTPTCKIKRVGCSCKTQQTCQTQKCICYKNKMQCQPYICKDCFPAMSQPKKNCCNNDQILRKMSKKIVVGISNIRNAGLGAFAGERYLKNQLITIYSGEHINQEMDQIRQCMMKVLSFYNFDSPNGKEIGASIDARFMGNKARFINHGNEGETNLHSGSIFSNGTEYIALYASRDIKAGEQLKFDYDGSGFLYLNHRDKYPFIREKKKQ